MPKRKQVKREEAEMRQEYYETLTLPERLSLARSRRGESRSEVTRLNKAILKESGKRVI